MKDEQESFVYAVQSHLNTYIKVADQKASILLTAQLAFLGLFSNALRTLFSDTGLLFHSLATLTTVAALAGIFLAGWVVYLEHNHRMSMRDFSSGTISWTTPRQPPTVMRSLSLRTAGFTTNSLLKTIPWPRSPRRNTTISESRSVLRQPWLYSRLLLAGCISSRRGQVRPDQLVVHPGSVQ
ncbi:hypothetical protein ACFQL0_20020 [Haloplanus litoreus]|uniref:hypothetical protein n=1 Tax=Haloplanus litoreus TaxID=767515 RepID=UPI0036167764